MMVRETEVVLKGKVLTAKDYAELTQLAMKYRSELTVEHRFSRANAKSVMGMISLDLKDGDKVMLIAKGEDEDEALDALAGRFSALYKTK